MNDLRTGAAWTVTRREGMGLDLHAPRLTPPLANQGGYSLAGAIPAASPNLRGCRRDPGLHLGSDKHDGSSPSISTI